MISIPLSQLASVAALKPQGYYDACVRAGRIVGDRVILTEDAFAALRARFSPLPPAAQIGSFLGAVAAECGAALNGAPAITPEQKAARLAICQTCEFLTPDRKCSQCGCWVEAKARFRAQTCPAGKWPPLDS